MENLRFLVTGILLIGMPIAMEIGRRIRHARMAKTNTDRELDESGVGALDAAVYALFGLLIAFIFSGAAARFDARRELIAQESNAIGTAYLRIDLLLPEAQAILRPLFRDYVDSRIASFQKMDDPEATRAEFERDLAMQNEIWDQVVAGARATGSPAVLSLTLPALNAMFDITTTRLAATRTHPPSIIYGMLVVVAFAVSLLSGMAMAKSPRRPWPHIVAFTLVISTTVFVILDIEHPRHGLIRVDDADQLLIDLRDAMSLRVSG